MNINYEIFFAELNLEFCLFNQSSTKNKKLTTMDIFGSINLERETFQKILLSYVSLALTSIKKAETSTYIMIEKHPLLKPILVLIMPK